MSFIDSIRDKNIHIVGICGAETSAIARYLHRSGCANLTLHDFNEPGDFKSVFDISHVSHAKDERERILDATLAIPAVKRFKDDYLKDILDADVIFVSQNWFNYDFNKPALLHARDHGIPFHTITDLYFSLSNARIIGITGTNGKTTTSNLIRSIMEKSCALAGGRVWFSGNDRYSKQILERIDEISEDDIVVLEISNRQLISLERSPHIAVITNIARDHIEEHGSFENYIAAKNKLFLFQTGDDLAVINYDDEITRGFADHIKSKVFFFSSHAELDDDCAYLKDDTLYAVINGEKIRLIERSELMIKGPHNVNNALCAALTALIAGAGPEPVRAALKEFKGIKNRLELIRSVSGVSFYNDISSTSPHATLAALNSFDAPVILIAGGMDKDMDYAVLADAIKEKVKTTILLPGTATDKLKSLIDTCEVTDTLSDAVDIAYAKAAEGDVVILSPAAANFFTMYATGKDGFNSAVKRLHRKPNASPQA